MSAAGTDAEIRERLREDLDTTFVVEAAAGTGKTTILVSRILSLLKTGRTQLSKIIAVTFTEKAAGEMKLRIRERVEKERASSSTSREERARLEAALEELEGARIGTIHSLCADLLRERPIDAGVDPIFAVASDDEAQAILDASFDSWFAHIVADPPEGIRRFLRRPARRNGASARRLLRDAAWRLIEHRDFDASWRRDPQFRREERIDAFVETLRAFKALVEVAPLADYPRKMLGEVCRWVDDLDHREAVAARDYDGLEALLAELSSKWLWKTDIYGKKHLDLLAEREKVREALSGFVEASEADLAACLRQELQPVVGQYEATKTAAGRLDFTDLLLRARDLLRHRPGARQDLQRRYTHLFVDEFQDTDPLQSEILLLLAAEDPAENDTERLRTVPGKLFVVGDPKQSIYAFRRADVALYQRIKARLREQGAERVYLSKSFRARAEIQEAVNAAFAPVMGKGSATQAEYVPLQLGRDDAPPKQPAVIALPVPYIYGQRDQIANWRIEESLPSAVAAFIEWLVDRSGWTVTETDRPGVPVSLQPRHVCVLFRRFQAFSEDVTRPYTTALEARRIPHVLVGGRSFHAREEVLALRNALSAIEWPDDELMVFATLRGAFFALQDDALMAFRGRFGSMHPLKPLDLTEAPPSVREVADALALLGRLHRSRNRRPIADTLSQLLEETRAHAGLAFWTAGEQALANVLHLGELARRFEMNGATSFRAFVEHLHAEAEDGQAEEARVVEEGTEGVRLMTVHRAKGLEFPVVILADITANATASRPSRHVDTHKRLWAESLAGCLPLELIENETEALARDREESVRLAYVAATRARDLLVVPAVGDREQQGWLEVLNPVIYPKAGTARAPQEPPATPRKGRDTVLDRPEDRFLDDSVAPGLQVPRAGSHHVVWWDPATLELARETDVDERREQVLVPKSPENARRGAEAYARWETERTEMLGRGGAPSSLVTTVREAAKDSASPGQIFTVHTTDGRRSTRPSGPRFGALVHGALARVPLEASGETIRGVVEAQARLLGASADEIAEAQVAVAAALRHPLWMRARTCAPEELRREIPVMLRRTDGALIEGVVDLAYRTRENGAARWIVIEIKTDSVEVAGLAPEYHAQLGLYVEAIREATGEGADGVIALV
jgi:ATP-dependent helicase/nuclease subunit A